MKDAKAAKATKETELDELAQPKIVHLNGAGVKAPNNVTTIELREPGTAPTLRSKGSYLLAERIDWHPAGLRVWTGEGNVFVVPMDRIDTVFQVRAK